MSSYYWLSLVFSIYWTDSKVVSNLSTPNQLNQTFVPRYCLISTKNKRSIDQFDKIIWSLSVLSVL